MLASHQRPLPRATQRSDAPLGGALDFMRLLWALDHGLHATSKRMFARLGVTGPQRLVLRLLGRFPGISAGQLARTMHVHPSTLTGILDRLEKRRLIARRPDPHDARRALLSLRSGGEQLDREAIGTVESAVDGALASLPDETLQAAETVLLAVIRALGIDKLGEDER